MDLIVLMMVLSIYIGAIAAPLSLLILARRTNQGPVWQWMVGMCAAIVWVGLILGLLREVFDLPLPRDVLELAGAAAMLAFAALAILGLLMVTRDWPTAAERSERRAPPRRLGPLAAADIE